MSGARQSTLFDGHDFDTPPFDPTQHGLFMPVRTGPDAYHLDTGKWLRARAENQPVGSCRWCGGDLEPLPTDPEHWRQATASVREWFMARCASCEREIASPDGKILKRSSLRSVQPRGWRDDREKTLRALGAPPEPA